MGRKKKRKIGECIFCGENAVIEKDHVPPKGIFPNPRPSTLITVPSCEKCHRETTMYDESFILMILSRHDVAKQPEALKIIPKIKRSFQRPESMLFRNSFYNSLRIRDVYYNGIYLGKTVTFRPDTERIYNVIRRTVKGLFFKHKGYRLPDECKLEVYIIQDTDISEKESDAIADNFIKIGIKSVIIADGVFSYHYHFFHEKNDSVWLLVFFDSVEVIVSIKCENS